MASADSSAHGASSRERILSTRSELTASPASTLRTAPSFSNQSSAAAPSSQPLTVEALLAAHAGATDSTSAALDAAVTERNTLSTQNAQLWKLIEKQRSGYGQLMKELERVRGERDAYRSRLQHLGENTDALLRAHKEKEKREGRDSTLRSAASHSHLRSSESGSSPVSEPRAHMTRTNSDDSAAHRSLQHERASAPRTHSNLREQYDSQTSLNIPASGSAGASTHPSPLSSNQSREATPEGSKPTLVQTPSREAFPNPYEDGTASSSTAELADPVLGHWQPGLRPSLDNSRQTLNSTPPIRTTPPRDDSPVRVPPSQPVPYSPVAPSPSRQPSPEKVPSSSPFSSSIPASVPTNTLSPYPNGEPHARPSALSRESRISLPEEARRYYANLADSPVPSPHVGSTGFTMGEGGSGGRTSPAKGQAQQTQTQNSQVLESPEARQRSAAGGDEAAPFLDMGDEDDSVYSSANGSMRFSNAEDREDPATDGQDGRRRHDPGQRSVTDDFPLPPSTPTYASSQATSIITSRSSSSSSVSHLDPSAHSTVTLPQSSTPVSPFPITTSSGAQPQMKFRALPLLASDIPHTQIHVVTSTIRPNDRGKEVLSFVISVSPGQGKDPWRVEKLYSDVLALDARVRAAVGKNVQKKLVALPEGRLWRDHAPAKVDQRKSALESYLRSLIALPVKNKDEVIAFFTSDIVRETQKPVSQAGYKEGYLTKRGKNFGGWKTRYFVLQGPSLEYYESRGGAHLGSITITNAQIGRQQRAPDRRDADEDNEFRHAFLIIEAKRGPGVSQPRHVLCADSDAERDNWVEELVRYVTGSYTEDQVAIAQNGQSTVAVGGSGVYQQPSQIANTQAPPRSSLSSGSPSDIVSTPNKRSKETQRAVSSPVAKLVTDISNGKLYPVTGAHSDDIVSPIKAAPSPVDRLIVEGPMSSSMPTTSPLLAEDVDVIPSISQRANSELGHYPDLVDPKANAGRSGTQSPDQMRKKRRMSVNPLKGGIPERTPSPEKEPMPTAVPVTPRVDVNGKVKISRPMNGTPIPAGYKFGGKDVSPAEATPSSSDRREKAKSRTFWGFGRHDKPNVPTAVPRAVFGVTLDESLDVAQIASLPAIVFRCIQYLEAKKAELEEGIYRLSGSNVVIKGLKDRFNAEGDVDLLGSDEYWDPHAIAGLLKTFLRELPASILTRDLHLRFLSVMDFVDPQERIQELSRLIASLPLANYSLLRALTAHLILIVQNANVNKMTMRNVGIVFSPTLGIPAGVFSLMLGEFKRVFNVDSTLEDEPEQGDEAEPGENAEGVDRRNSRRYTDAAADELLGLAGRQLPKAADDGQSDQEEEASVIEGSGEDDSTLAESSAASSSVNVSQQGQDPTYLDSLRPPESNLEVPMSPGGGGRSRASNLAASRGLNIMTDKAAHRRSGIVGLPVSPRPSPRNLQNGSSASPVVTSPLATPR